MRLRILLLLSSLLFVPSCDDADERKAKSKKQPGITRPKRDVSTEVEAFTGAHTRLVWAACLKQGDSDTFATTDGLILVGLDTRDGHGERIILSKPGNYSRPVLTCDGSGILYSDKNVVRKGGKKHYKPVIYLIGWKGGKPIRLGDGYAVDCWRDPATGVEWVYAARDMRATKGVSLEAQRIVRFPLREPEKEETIYAETPVSPDNLQFSRDGTQACGLFPWPHAGILTQRDGKWKARQLTTGCWTSHSPDNSGVMWAFDGDHRRVQMFANEGAKIWQISFSEAPGAKGREMYHPRWSNHPRYIVMTGPYTKQRGQDGSVINKGGMTAQVMLARLSPKADRVEAWLQVSSDKAGESYPDVWIEGGDQANLDGYLLTHEKPALAADEWPAKPEGLLFLWRDRTALNTFVQRDGQKREARIESREAGRFGRFQEMRLDGGRFEVEVESAEGALSHLKEKPEAAWEALVLPAADGTSEDAKTGTMIYSSDWMIGVENGKLTVGSNDGIALKSSETLPSGAFHLAVNRRGGSQDGIEAFVNGKPLALAAADSAIVRFEGNESIAFGGGWSGGLLNVAIYDRALGAEEVATNAQAMLQRAAALPAAPPRVRLQAKLVEVSAMPTPEGIEPYASALVTYVYEVQKVLEGEFKEPRVLVRHWAMLDLHRVEGVPREEGKTYELTLERASDHPQLKGERVMDDTTAFDLEAWFDVAPPRVVVEKKE